VPGKDSITGVNFRMKTDRNLGPGEYKNKESDFKDNSEVKGNFGSAVRMGTHPFNSSNKNDEYRSKVGPGGY
jgi:hypothetical protein